MQNLLNYSLQLTFFFYGGLALLLSLKCYFTSSKNASVFFISFIISFVIGYSFKQLFYNNNFKKKNLAITIFFSWILLILVSAIPFFSLVDLITIGEIFFISASFVTTTGFQNQLFESVELSESYDMGFFIQLLRFLFYSYLYSFS